MYFDLIDYKLYSKLRVHEEEPEELLNITKESAHVILKLPFNLYITESSVAHELLRKTQTLLSQILDNPISLDIQEDFIPTIELQTPTINLEDINPQSRVLNITYSQPFYYLKDSSPTKEDFINSCTAWAKPSKSATALNKVYFKLILGTFSHLLRSSAYHNIIYKEIIFSHKTFKNIPFKYFKFFIQKFPNFINKIPNSYNYKLILEPRILEKLNKQGYLIKVDTSLIRLVSSKFQNNSNLLKFLALLLYSKNSMHPQCKVLTIKLPYLIQLLHMDKIQNEYNLLHQLNQYIDYLYEIGLINSQEIKYTEESNTFKHLDKLKIEHLKKREFITLQFYINNPAEISNTSHNFTCE